MLEVMPYILNSLYVLMIIVTLVLLIKIMKLVEKATKIAEDVEKKMEKTNSIFNAIETVGTGIDIFNNKIVKGFISKFTKNKEEERDEE